MHRELCYTRTTCELYNFIKSNQYNMYFIILMLIYLYEKFVVIKFLNERMQK